MWWDVTDVSSQDVNLCCISVVYQWAAWHVQAMSTGSSVEALDTGAGAYSSMS